MDTISKCFLYIVIEVVLLIINLAVVGFCIYTKEWLIVATSTIWVFVWIYEINSDYKKAKSIEKSLRKSTKI